MLSKEKLSKVNMEKVNKILFITFIVLLLILLGLSTQVFATAMPFIDLAGKVLI